MGFCHIWESLNGIVCLKYPRWELIPTFTYDVQQAEPRYVTGLCLFLFNPQLKLQKLVRPLADQRQGLLFSFGSIHDPQDQKRQQKEVYCVEDGHEEKTNEVEEGRYQEKRDEPQRKERYQKPQSLPHVILHERIFLRLC